MIDLTEKNQLTEFLKANKLWLRKQSGQHFLVNQTVLHRIVESAELESDERVLEIGPGVGTLTQALAGAVPQGLVLAIEKDPRLVATLRNEFDKFKNVKIVHADALRFVAGELGEDQNYKVVANLPYNITGPFLRKIFEPNSDQLPFDRHVYMLQREVVDRLLAKPGDSSRGVLTILRELYGPAEKIIDVPKEDFFPIPKVDSAVIKIVPGQGAGNLDDKLRVLHLAKLGFAAKRRTLANTLSAGLRRDKAEVNEMLKKVNLDPSLRAEDLSLDDWQRLVQVIN